MHDVEKMAGVVHDYMGEVIGPLLKRIDDLEQRAPDVEAIAADVLKRLPTPKDGAPGKDGSPGKDGTSVTADDVLPALIEHVDAAIAQIPQPQDGKDGKDGADGKSFTEAEVEAILMRKQAEWELAFERRAQDTIQRALDKIQQPKDGKDGKDGADGYDAFQLEETEFELMPDERTLKVKFVRHLPGDTEYSRMEYTHDVKLAHMLYRGIWAPQEYQRGDCVTWGGSLWHANKDTAAKPDTDDSWQLAVKRGRDGKDGRDGIDMTQPVKVSNG